MTENELNIAKDDPNIAFFSSKYPKSEIFDPKNDWKSYFQMITVIRRASGASCHREMAENDLKSSGLAGNDKKKNEFSLEISQNRSKQLYSNFFEIGWKLSKNGQN